MIVVDGATHESRGGEEESSASRGGGEEESSASRASAVESPSDEVHASVAAKTRQRELLLQEQGSLGINICPFTLLHPQDGVLWIVGPPSATVFERSTLIRFIHNVGQRDLLSDFHHLLSDVINVTNPVNRGSFLRINVMSLIEELPPARCNTLRLLRQMSGDAAYTAELVPRAMSSNEESSSINE